MSKGKYYYDKKSLSYKKIKMTKIDKTEEFNPPDPGLWQTKDISSDDDIRPRSRSRSTQRSTHNAQVRGRSRW